jgi:CDP-paratose 2-epimerase
MSVLVTGGAGFIGANVVHRLIEAGEEVRILDNLSRPGVERNIRWLEEVHGRKFELVVADVREREVVRGALTGIDHVFHFAAQVAVTGSITDPRFDFDVNAAGTLVLLEAIRARKAPPSILYASTNKVYGTLEDIALDRSASRYSPSDLAIASSGVSEARPLSFHSPYGCSKGSADQYVLDYAHTFGLRTVVFRMSCIYGPRQFGNEDQGWVAHLVARALRGEPITIYGDGLQVRDLLFIDDLIAAFQKARERITQVSGRAFNVGGGPGNTMSLLELIDAIERRTHQRPRVSFADWRRADQRYYVSDIGAIGRELDWAPRTPAPAGLEQLFAWLEQQPENRPREAAPIAASP